MIFHVLKQKNGRVSGTLFYETSTGFILTANYDEAVFAADGKTVYLHGIVTFASNASLIGYPTVQKVTDNGEGKRADPDAVSAIASGPFVPADWVPYLDGFGMLGIIDGNIQVLAH